MDNEKIKRAREEAIYKIGELIDNDDFGGMTTGMCKVLGISMDQFLIYAQMPAHNQRNIIVSLWEQLSKELYS